MGEAPGFPAAVPDGMASLQRVPRPATGTRMSVPAPQEVPARVSGPHGRGRGGGEAPARRRGDPGQQRAVSAGGMAAGAAPGLEGPPQHKQVRARARAGVTGSQSRGPRRGCPIHTSVSKAPSRARTRCAPAGDGGANDLLEDAVACLRFSPLREAEFLSVSLGLSSLSPPFPLSPSSPAPSSPSPPPLSLLG